MSSLTDTDLVNIRRFAGYPLIADTVTDESSDDAYIYTRRIATTLASRLDNLSSQEETVLTTYLTTIAALETGQLDAVDTVDTSAAGTWQSNPLEIAQRRRMFNMWRRDMCRFLGVEPGPGLPNGQGTITRG